MFNYIGIVSLFLFFLKRDKNLKFREIKDSSTFILKTTEDLTNKKFFAVKLVEELDEELEEENDKLITISKPSKWIIIFILVLYNMSQQIKNVLTPGNSLWSRG